MTPAPVAEKPVFIRTPDRVSAGVDWLRVVGRGRKLAAERLVTSWAMGDAETWNDKHYGRRLRFPGGLEFKSGNRANEDAWLVEMTGEFLSLVHHERLREWLLDLDRDCGPIKFSRIDCAVDVQTRKPDPSILGRVFLANSSGDLKVAFSNIESSKGRTAYIGSRESPAFMRVYDKGAQVGSIPDTWIRFEAEFKRERAAAMTRKFLGSTAWDALAWGYAAGAVPELEASDPDLFARVFLHPALSEPVETQFAALDQWIEAFRTQYGGRIRSLADLCNLTPLQVVEMLGLLDAKPLERTHRHGDFFRAAVIRLGDIMETDGD